MKDIDVSQDCYLVKNSEYIINSAKTLTSYVNTFRYMLLDIKSEVFKEEKDLYNSINKLSTLSANIYLLSFFLIILISIIIIFIDMRTHRGANEK